MVMTSEQMQAAIARWLWCTVTAPSVRALLPDLPGAERLLRRKGFNELPPMIRPGIFGDARIDNLLNDWLKEHRMKEVRNADQDSEHELRDLLARQGVGVRPYKGPQRR
jgi:hypothetical protein